MAHRWSTQYAQHLDYDFVTYDDLPIQLDDLMDDRTAIHKPSSASLVRLFRIPKPKSKSKFLSFLRRRKTKSILDEFPKPPTFVPTPAKRPSPSRWGFSWSQKSTRFQRGEEAGHTRANFQSPHIDPEPSPTSTLVDVGRYQLVNVCDLYATSPSPLKLACDLPTTNPSLVSFAPDSPSWLSRNVASFDFTQLHSIKPSIPHLLLLSSSQDSLLSPLEATETWLSPLDPPVADLTSLSRKSSQSSIAFPSAFLPPEESHTEPTAVEAHFNSSLLSSPHSHSESYQIFTPNQTNTPESILIPLPTELINIMVNLDFAGKQAPVVDFGGEFDYEGHQWFQDPPQRPAQPEPQPPAAPYVPVPAVIDQNEMFEFALSAAPNVLYGRYKQYGQLGVLAWCSEFGELIDGIKELGINGNMFVSTRAQALQTCSEILSLKLDVKMQIIVMYMSSQVARLRRFLDGDRVWDDYPEPSFPLEPRSYT